jgi:hypothetical protein
VFSTVDDDKMLDFDEGTGDYEGVAPDTDGYNYFTVTAKVYNSGEAQANNVVATLLLDAGVVPVAGEELRKKVTPEDLVAGNGVGEVTWKLKPIRQPATRNHTFQVRLSAENSDISWCSYQFEIEGAPKDVEVTIPNNLVGQFGDKIAVPIEVSETIGSDVGSYKINVKYDPTIVKFISATNEGTQTQFGWNGPKTNYDGVATEVIPWQVSPTEAIIRVEDFTTGSPLASKTRGVLVYLLFEGAFGGDEATKLDYGRSALAMKDLSIAKFTWNGKDYWTTMNSTIDDKDGDVRLQLTDGQVIVSGDCIVPLNSSLKFQLAQNKPNPFNPTTVIEYTVGFDTHVKLEVFDALGRHVTTLVNEFQKAGEYRRMFDATSLPSGTYYYKYETPRFTDMKRMVLTR